MMEEYPRNLTELEAAFATEQDCRAYLARLRWPDGFRCPRCGGGKSWTVRGVLLECAACGCQTSVTAGTIFQDTRTPLPGWFRALCAGLGRTRERHPHRRVARLRAFGEERLRA